MRVRELGRGRGAVIKRKIEKRREAKRENGGCRLKETNNSHKHAN